MPKRTNDFQQLIAMLVELLDDGAVVEESKEFPDPDTGNLREVDVYALVRGNWNQQEIAVAVECVDRKRKRDVTWVEMIYGKHSVLQVADVVLLVSSSGFYHSAEIKARKFGYRTISPAISPIELGKALGVASDFRMGAMASSWSFTPMNFDTPVPGQLVDDGYFHRADGSKLVTVDDYRARALADEWMKDGASTIMSAQPSTSMRNVMVAEPEYDGERLHALLTVADGQTVVLPVLNLRFTATGDLTNWGHFGQTERGNVSGVQFGTGTSTIGGQPGRMVVAETEGAWRATARWEYTATNPEAGSSTAS